VASIIASFVIHPQLDLTYLKPLPLAIALDTKGDITYPSMMRQFNSLEAKD
jgi:hypothetical protein